MVMRRNHSGEDLDAFRAAPRLRAADLATSAWLSQSVDTVESLLSLLPSVRSRTAHDGITNSKCEVITGLRLDTGPNSRGLPHLEHARSGAVI